MEDGTGEITGEICLVGADQLTIYGALEVPEACVLTAKPSVLN